MPNEYHPGGYRRHNRDEIGKRDPEERRKDNEEIWAPDWDEEELRDQGERCMDCGTPTCMSGCPLGNLIPEWNHHVYQDNWEEGLNKLHATNNFPEFTGYTCPAPCEDICTLSYNKEPVTIKNIERALADKGWEEGWIEPQPPDERTDYEVAIVGSGPAGMAAAQQLNRVGHNVTIFERDETAGGLMTYGLPEFKFEREKVLRRVRQLKEEGVEIETGVEVGGDGDVSLEELKDEFDAVCLAVGAQKHKNLTIPGSNLEGIEEAMDYLTQENRRQHDEGKPRIDAEGKCVVVLGGGDTGADCVATAHRQGAKQVVQIGINEKLPEERTEDNPWPEKPLVYEKTYAQKEGGVEEFSVNTKEFVDEDGDGRVDCLKAEQVEWEYDENKNRIDKEVVEPELRIPADLVLVAIGFRGPESDAFGDTGVKLDDKGTIKTDDRMMTTSEGVFAAGDANRGASLVVWAIGEGRDVARHIDKYLTGETELPPSLQTPNPPAPEK